MWDWPEEQFRTRNLADEPALAEFARGLAIAEDGLLEIEESVVTRYGLQCLPLVEWNHSSGALKLFAVLRRAGSTRGFFIDYPGQEELGSRFRVCELSEAAAIEIAKRDLFGWATIFVDDSLQSVLASWFTDFTHLCMSPPLSAAYFAADPMLLDLRGDDAEGPARDYASALQAARKRETDWNLLVEEMRRKSR
jgi:hypothetical protein